jgi:hypothetical protein
VPELVLEPAQPETKPLRSSTDPAPSKRFRYLM